MSSQPITLAHRENMKNFSKNFIFFQENEMMRVALSRKRAIVFISHCRDQGSLFWKLPKEIVLSIVIPLIPPYDFKPPQFSVAVFGPVGCGKTTLSNQLLYGSHTHSTTKLHHTDSIFSNKFKTSKSTC